MSLTPESLALAMNNNLSLQRANQFYPAMNAAMLAAECTTVNRAAMWMAQIGHESADLKYMAEIQTSDPSWSADRTRYRGRGPIQLTWSSNYRKFGQWCKTQGYITDSELFVKQPELVEEPKWGFLAASWYWLFGGPRPGKINAYADQGDILAVSRCINGWLEDRMPNGFSDRKERWNETKQMGDAIVPANGGIVVPVVPDNRPDFNEIDQIGWDSADPHGSIRSRPPINWFIHTQEANSNATDLAAWMRSTTGNNAVSYHYTVHQDPNDHGVTVVDVIDTDLYSWSVLDANVFSINACFAGSFAGWTREQWLSKAGRAIDVMAYLAVQDCKKYPTMAAHVVPPPYAVKGPCISDHRYVTKALGIGDHTDVGNGFPWDVFTAAVRKYVEGEVQAPDVPNQPPPKQLTDRQLLQETWDQLRGIDGQGWPQLDNLTPVDYLAGMGKKLDELLKRTEKAV